MMNPEYEVDPENTAGIRNIALACKKSLKELLKNERAQEDAVNAKKGNWSSRQWEGFEEWYIMIGVDDEGLQAIDIRLKYFPGIFEVHGQLLQQLEDDLKELQQFPRAPEHVVNIDDSVDHSQPDSSSLSYTPLFSSDESQAEGASSASEKRNAELRKRVEDTISQLRDHRITIDYVLREQHQKKSELQVDIFISPIIPSDIETFVIENAKGVFGLARLLLNQGLEFEQKGITQDAIIEEFNSARPVLDLYRDFIKKGGPFLQYARTIDDAIVHLYMDDEAQASFEDAHGQTLVSWATARKRKAAIKPLLDEGTNQSPLALPAFLSLSQKDIEINHRELYWAEQPREKDGLRYKQSNVRMDRYDEDYTPWAHNRVKLQVPENTYDYVNASPITLKSFSTIIPSLRYIAMQGPINPSFDHVWRMVAEQTSSSSPSVIVQLTEMVEKGEEYIRQCDQYFPMGGEDTTRSINNKNRWGDNWKAQLTLDSKEVIADGAIEKRLLVLRISKNGGEKETRLIWHFLYKRWPDSGVPTEDDLDSLLHLMTLSKQIEHSAPGDNRIIHCSDGVGRTGCFIALDHLLRELRFGLLERYNERFQGLDLVHHTVDVLRQQRWGMVQSKEQYQFIYQVMRKRWYNKYGVADEKAGNHK